jgi:hypothetical protein
MSRRGATLVVACLGVSLAGPVRAETTAAPAVAGDEVRRYPPSSVRVPVIVGGGGLFGAAYGLSALSASAWPTTPGSPFLYVPLAGPWITLGHDYCSSTEPGCSAILYLRGILYVVDGLVQIGGTALMVEGFVMTTEGEAATAPRTAWSIAPWLAPGTQGIGVHGSF